MAASWGILDALEQDGELIAAETTDRVTIATHGPESLGDLDEDLVAGAVADGVVDRLEVIDVEHHDRMALAAVQGAIERVLGPVLKQGRVGEVGEAVMERLVLQLPLQPLALGDVAAVDHDRRDLGILAQVIARVLEQAPEPSRWRIRHSAGAITAG